MFKCENEKAYHHHQFAAEKWGESNGGKVYLVQT